MALAHAILALLIRDTRSGYDLNKTFQGSVGFFWQATHQQIYRELGKLEAQGLVSAEKVAQEGRPDKKLYRITERGQQHLKDWIAQPCEPMLVREELMVKVFVGGLAEPALIAHAIQTHRHLHAERLHAYREVEAQFFPDPQKLSLHGRLEHLVLRRGIRYEQDWLSWCDEALAFLATAIAD